MACSSVEGASTLSEALVVGLYQYIFLCPPSRKGRCLGCVPHATSTKTPVEVVEVLSVSAPIHRPRGRGILGTGVLRSSRIPGPAPASAPDSDQLPSAIIETSA